jgi:hypothetical protein
MKRIFRRQHSRHFSSSFFWFSTRCVCWYLPEIFAISAIEKHDKILGTTFPRDSISRKETAAGRPRTERTPEYVDRERAAVLQSPRRSARRQSVALQLPNNAVCRILRRDLNFHPYKVQLIQELSDRGVENRQRFCEQVRVLLNDADDLQNNLIMTDEAHFHLSGYVNKQNFRYWAPDKPLKMHQRPLHNSKVTVWCCVASFGVVGPFFLRTRTVLQQIRRQHTTFRCSKPLWFPRLSASDANVESYGGNRMGPQPIQPEHLWRSCAKCFLTASFSVMVTLHGQ